MEAFDYRFDKIFVLKSLGEADTYADALYGEVIEPCCKKYGLATEQPINIFDRGDWDKAIEKILEDEHVHPFVHIECHGDRDKGLELRLGDYIPWNELIDDLRKVNLRSGMNLIVTMATCFSIRTAFNIKMYNQAAPYLISLTSRDEKIKTEITYTMYSIFFEELIKTCNLHQTLKRVGRERPDLAQHFVLLTVPFLFENVWKGVPELYKSGDEIVRNFIHSFPEFQATVIKSDISKEEFEGYRDGFVRECNADTFNAIYRRCRDEFFMYDAFPENRQRFKLPDSIK